MIYFHLRLKIPRFPFDWHNPVGYSAAIALLYILFFNGSIVAIAMTALSIGISGILISLTEDIIVDLKSFNKNARQIKKNRSEIAEQFACLIQIHSNSMQLSDFWRVFFYCSVIHRKKCIFVISVPLVIFRSCWILCTQCYLYWSQLLFAVRCLF